MGQQEALEKELSGLLENLLALVRKCSTDSVVGWCFGYQLSAAHEGGKEERLASPAKQIPFLLSLLLSTAPPDQDHSMTDVEWKEAKTILDRLFSVYMHLYFPSEEQLGKLSKEWRQSREVSMLAFLHYFNTGLLASIEQIVDRVKRYAVPFDEALRKALGVSASDALSVARWIANRLQTDMDNLQEAAINEKDARLAMLDQAKAQRWSSEDLRKAAQEPAYFEKASRMLSGLQNLGRISKVELVKAFPETAEAFLRAFSIRRGEAPGLRYPTEESIYLSKPLVQLPDEAMMVASANAIFEAVLIASERTLFNGPTRDDFLRYRDKELEREALEHIKPFLDRDALLYSEVCEKTDSQLEHDVIAEDSHLQIVLEAKASPPKEPFRDPDKAFPRLRNAFRGDKGIQNAFVQGNRIVQRLKNKETVPLYDKKGKQVAELKPDAEKLPVCICVTRDNFGGLATRLSLLLEKEDADSFPWVVNILDLANLAMAWSYLKWGSQEFRRYLEQRSLLHHKGLADDELDFAGYFVRHGDFKEALESRANVFQFNPDYSSVFDEIYRHVHLGGPPVVIKQTKPVMMDLKRSLARGKPVFATTGGDATGSGRRRATQLRKRKEKARARMRKQSQARNRKKH